MGFINMYLNFIIIDSRKKSQGFHTTLYVFGAVGPSFIVQYHHNNGIKYFKHL